MVTLDEIKKLSIVERVNLVESIWDSIAEETTPAELKISEEEKAEIQRRYLDFKNGNQKTYSWEDVKNYAFDSRFALHFSEASSISSRIS